MDRAGLVGNDGETHQGNFDLSFLGMLPNMTVCAPKNRYELADMLRFAYQHEGPIAVRYPRGEAWEGCQDMRSPIVLGKSEILHQGEQVAIVALGSMVETAMMVRELLSEQGIEATIVNARFMRPLDTECLDGLCENNRLIVTMEDNILAGGFGEAVTTYIKEKEQAVRILTVGVPDIFVEQGNVSKLKQMLGMDAHSVFCKIMDEWQKELRP